MAEFNIGDVVYLKDEFIERFKRYSAAAKQTTLTPGQDRDVQIGLAKDIPFTIVRRYGTDDYLTDFTDSWGELQNLGRGMA